MAKKNLLKNKWIWIGIVAIIVAVILIAFVMYKRENVLFSPGCIDSDGYYSYDEQPYIPSGVIVDGSLFADSFYYSDVGDIAERNPDGLLIERTCTYYGMLNEYNYSCPSGTYLGEFYVPELQENYSARVCHPDCFIVDASYNANPDYEILGTYYLETDCYDVEKCDKGYLRNCPSACKKRIGNVTYWNKNCKMHIRSLIPSYPSRIPLEP